MRGRSVLGTTLGLLLVVAMAPVAVSTNSPSQSPAWEIEEAVENDIRFRRSIGFRSDYDFVYRLYVDPSSGAEEMMGSMLVPGEVEELTRRVAMEADADAIDAWFRASSATMSVYGGVMIDHLAGGKLVVMITAGASEVGDGWRSLVTHSDRLAIRVVQHSLVELKTLQSAIRSALASGEPVLAGWLETALDIDNNSVVVAFEQEAMERLDQQAFHDRFGTSGLLITTTEPAVATVNLANDPDAPPVYGGHSWKKASHSGAYCSLGFNVGRSGYSSEWMITAGHCVDQIALGVSLYHASRLIGTRDIFQYGPGDFGLIKMSDTGTSGPHVWYLNQSTGYHTLRGVVGTNTSYTVGNIRCFTGWKSDWTECGPITVSSADRRYCSDCPLVEDLAKYDVSPEVGDSGGAVFRYLDGYAYAAGFQSGANSTYTKGYFAKWSNLPSAWDIILKVYTPPPCLPCVE